MGRCRRFRKRSPLPGGSAAFFDRPLDADTYRDTIGEVVYDRVMEWDDSGAAKALQEAEQRKKAREIRKPCWLPKLSDDLYICTVDWNTRDSGEVCSMPKSAETFTDESCGEFRSMPTLSLTKESKEQEHSLPALDLHELSSRKYGQQVLEASSEYPLTVDAVLERCADGFRLLVGGWPVEPSGWDEEISQFADGPWIVEAVLEDFGDGQRLLVGGWPVQPSWDELDTNWSQLGWEGYTAKPKYWEYMQVQSSWNFHRSVCLSQESFWQSSWYHRNFSYSLHRGQNFMMAF